MRGADARLGDAASGICWKNAKVIHQMAHPATTRILAILESDLDCYRGLQLGIADFAELRQSWHVDVHRIGKHLRDRIEQTKPQGLILGPAWQYQDEARDAIRRIPHTIALCSFLSLDPGSAGIAEVGPDDVEVGRLAAEHFLEKGFENFGYISAPAQSYYSQHRYKGFSESILAAGHSTALWESSSGDLELHSELSPIPLAHWLQAQPKPLALFVCTDARAYQCAQICIDSALHVPGDVAILGVDNDQLFCRLCRPPLSSVAIPWERIGYRAAEMLDQLIGGRPVAPGLHTVPATGVYERQSTDVVAVTDPDIRLAIEFIRNNFHQPITVDDVVNTVSMSRREFEKRFQRLIKQTPLDAIRSARLGRAKKLLATTELSIDEIAIASGFASLHWFDKVFKQFVQCTPSQYRQLTTAGMLAPSGGRGRKRKG